MHTDSKNFTHILKRHVVFSEYKRWRITPNIFWVRPTTSQSPLVPLWRILNRSRKLVYIGRACCHHVFNIACRIFSTDVFVGDFLGSHDIPMVNWTWLDTQNGLCASLEGYRTLRSQRCSYKRLFVCSAENQTISNSCFAFLLLIFINLKLAWK